MATSRARTRSDTYAVGVVPSGGTSPFEATSTAARSPIRVPISPTHGGQRGAGHGQDDEVDAGEVELRDRAHLDRAVELDAGQVVGVLVLRGEALGLRRVRQPSWTWSPARASTAALAVPMQPAPTTAAVRSGGMPPSHSHWSSTQGQMRSVTSPARKGEGSLDAREGQRRAEADVHLRPA